MMRWILRRIKRFLDSRRGIEWWCQICGVGTPRHENYCETCRDILEMAPAKSTAFIDEVASAYHPPHTIPGRAQLRELKQRTMAEIKARQMPVIQTEPSETNVFEKYIPKKTLDFDLVQAQKNIDALRGQTEEAMKAQTPPIGHFSGYTHYAEDIPVTVQKLLDEKVAAEGHGIHTIVNPDTGYGHIIATYAGAAKDNPLVSEKTEPPNWGIPEEAATEAHIDKLIERLEGTTDGLDDTLSEVLGIEFADSLKLPAALLAKLDAAIMVCEGCDWWTPASELEDGLCSDCV